MEITKILVDTLQKGGSTTNPHGGFIPVDGYMISIDGFERKIPLDDFCIRSIKSFITASSSMLSNSGHYLGSWVDGGNVYLDISIHNKDLVRAKDIAKLENQKAIYDIKNDKSIYL